MNDELKNYANSKKVKLWQVAEKFGVVDNTFSRWLRKEFTPERKKLFKQYVDEIAKEKRCSK